MSSVPTLSHLQRDASLLANPYPWYEKLERVHVDPVWRVLILSRYDDVMSVLRHDHYEQEKGFSARVYRAEKLQAPALAIYRPLYHTLNAQFIFMDRPDHARLRGFVNPMFLPDVLQAQGIPTLIRQLGTRLLDRVQARGQSSIDIMADFAYPLPLLVIATMLGLATDDEHLERLARWSESFTEVIGHFGLPEHPHRIVSQWEEMHTIFQERLDALSQQPPDIRAQTLLGQILNAQQLGQIRPEEVIPTGMLLLIAGHRNTTNAICNLVLLLLRHPDQMALLRSNPSLLPRAIEEGLRYDPPAQFTGRIAQDEESIGGCPVHQGQGLLLALAAANRDTVQLHKTATNPNVFDIRRPKLKHLSFGYGAHYCSGTALARMEITVALQLLFERFPHLQLAIPFEQLKWSNISMRGIQTLPIAVHA